MPNTLVHFGVQSVSTKALFRGADFKWIAVGCIIPDVPWIVQRLAVAAQAGIDLFALRQYAIVQASLFCCLLLCGAIALLTAPGVRVFLVLAGNSLLHLLLDAMQIKWANGVHLFAPFSWKLAAFGFFWPEHWIFYVFTAAGFAALLYFGIKDWKKRVVVRLNPVRSVLVLLLLAMYFLVPFWLRSEPLRANNHYLAALRNVDERPGKYLELDRGVFRTREKTVEAFSGERINLTGELPDRDAIVSVQGVFQDRETVRVLAYHVHGPVRDLGSAVALAGILLVWLAALIGRRVGRAGPEGFALKL